MYISNSIIEFVTNEEEVFSFNLFFLWQVYLRIEYFPRTTKKNLSAHYLNFLLYRYIPHSISKTSFKMFRQVILLCFFDSSILTIFLIPLS